VKTFNVTQIGTDTTVSLNRNDFFVGACELREKDFDFAIKALSEKKEQEFGLTTAQKATLDYIKDHAGYDLCMRLGDDLHRVDEDGTVTNTSVHFRTGVKVLYSTPITHIYNGVANLVWLLTYEDGFGDLETTVLYPTKD